MHSTYSYLSTLEDFTQSCVKSCASMKWTKLEGRHLVLSNLSLAVAGQFVRLPRAKKNNENNTKLTFLQSKRRKDKILS